jgi:hypothetical protein
MKRNRIIAWLLTVLLLGVLPVLAAEQKPVIGTTGLMEAMSGTYYGNRIVAEGERPMLFAITGGLLPKGLTLSESGILTGVPQYPGDYTFTMRVTNPAGSSYANYNLHVAPYDESRMQQGGQDSGIIGSGQDSLNGVANAINGGRVTMQEGSVFFVDAKGYLYQWASPFEKKPSLLFKPREYRQLDSLPNMLYYWQHYLDNEATVTNGKPTYVTRLVYDPIVGKGRDTLLSMRLKDCSSLSVTPQVALFIGYDHVMTRVGLESKRGTDLRVYHSGEEIKADQVFPYNGKAWLRQVKTGHLYSAWMDGQLAQPLVQEKVLCYTLGPSADQPLMYFADSKKALWSVSLDGENKQRVGELKASALNANEHYVFFADAGKKNVLTMFPKDNPAELTRLSDFAVDQIYAFEGYVAFQKKGTKQLYLLALGTEDKPLRLI